MSDVKGLERKWFGSKLRSSFCLFDRKIIRFNHKKYEVLYLYDFRDLDFKTLLALYKPLYQEYRKIFKTNYFHIIKIPYSKMSFIYFDPKYIKDLDHPIFRLKLDNGIKLYEDSGDSDLDEPEYVPKDIRENISNPLKTLNGE
jgi:hypothetical protein